MIDPSSPDAATASGRQLNGALRPCLRYAHVDYAAAIDAPLADPSLWPVVGPSPNRVGFVLTRLAPTAKNDAPPIGQFAPGDDSIKPFDHLPKRRARGHLAFCPMGNYVLEIEAKATGGSELSLYPLETSAGGRRHTLAKPRVLDLDERAFNLAFSADGSVIAIASASNILFIEAATLEAIAEAETDANPDDACALAIDPRGYSLIVPDLHGMQLIPLRDRTIDQPLPFIDLHQGSQDVPGPGSADFNPDASVDLGPIAIPLDDEASTPAPDLTDQLNVSPDELARFASEALGRPVSPSDLEQSLAAVGMTFSDLLDARERSFDIDATAGRPPQPSRRDSSPIISVGVTHDSRWLYICSAAVMRVYDWSVVESEGGELPDPAIELYAGGLPGRRASLVGPAVYDEISQRLVIGHSLSGLLHLDLTVGRNFNLAPPPEGMAIRAFCLSLDRQSLCCVWEPEHHDADQPARHLIEVWDYPPLVKKSTAK